MISFLRAAAGVVAAVLAFTACGSASPSLPASHHLAATACARAEAAISEAALIVAPFARVTTRRGLAAAARKLGEVSRNTAAGGDFSYAFLAPAGLPRGKSPQPLARELRSFTADQSAFWAAWVAYSRSQVHPRSVGTAASRTIRDIRAIGTSCPARASS